MTETPIKLKKKFWTRVKSLVKKFWTRVKSLVWRKKPISQLKRDIIRFNGPTTKAIDLGKCISIDLIPHEKKILFHSAKEHPDSIESENEATAASIYDVIVRIWGGDVGT
jgi:hypothetical protein